jgi:Di-haem cytochrome c peroxidase
MDRQKNRSGVRPASTGSWRSRSPGRTWVLHAAIASTALVLGGVVVAGSDEDDRNDARANHSRLRNFIGQQVGGIEKLMVPARNADIPVPPGPAAEPYRYETTEAKRFLGKMLFHDPVRTTRININENVPVNLPAGTAFGGTVDGSNPNVRAIVDATRQTGGCGTCHFGEAASKAGQQINLHVGAEGRGYTDESGKFIVRRRTQEILVKKRTTPIFPGDTLVDALPTLTDIDIIKGNRVVTTPAPFYHPELGAEKLLATGRLDELDSVGRMSMSVIGFAFNNRLLFGGLAGEPPSSLGGINPLNAPGGDPAGENIALLLLDAHRMLGTQSEALRSNPVFVKLFQDAFPREAAAAGNDLTKLIDDQTVLRATATFMRTVVTRNTPFDRFVSGDGNALSGAQRRGARLFFTKATEGGAGCVACHSGPMLNKQVNDPDVAGIGRFVEENFINVGIGDHPVQALNAEARGRLDRNRLGRDGFPYHAEDTGRQEITGNPDHAFKFRSLTLRQLRDGGNFFHNASFTKVRDVVEYFNAGVPQDPTAGAAPTLDARFTYPRGPGTPRGLGLSKRQIDDLTDFLENGLYDPAFRDDDPNSTTDRFQPSKRDLTYSKYRPDLAALGAKDGLMPSGLAINNNDPLSRRDQGLEFLDVTSQAVPFRVRSDSQGNHQHDVYRITNNGTTVVDTHLLTIVRGLPRQASLNNASGTTRSGDPYIRLFLKEGALQPGQSAYAELQFTRPKDVPRLNYRLELLSGQGKP